MKLAALAVLAALVACKSSGSSSEDDGRYRLACDTTDTEGRSTWRCAKIDSRRGKVELVNLETIKDSDGLGFETKSAIGRYELYCNSTDVDSGGTFRCVRLDTRTGTVAYVLTVDDPQHPGEFRR